MCLGLYFGNKERGKRVTTIHGESTHFSQHLAQTCTMVGNAFLAQQQNEALRQQILNGTLSPAGYYTHLQRLVYRMLLLMVAEARGVLPAPEATRRARQRYQHTYALSTGTPPAAGPRVQPMYQRLLTILGWLGGLPGGAAAAVPALGTFLCPSPALGILTDCVLSDEVIIALQQALQAALALHPQLPEDMGQVHGDLIDYVHSATQPWQPSFQSQSGSFQLSLAPGSTLPDLSTPSLAPSLVAHVLDQALEPVVQDALASQDPENALLHCTICDPACGTGTLLRAAARRLAGHLSHVGGREPQQTLAYVICHCLYGVDRDEAAVELCRLSLALDAFSPGTALTSLEQHIAWGDSLAGTTPALLAQGIPDAAFTAVADDAPGTVLALRKRNQHERQGQLGLPFLATHQAQSTRPRRGRRAQSASRASAVVSPLPGSAAHATLLADAWCAAFVWPKTPGAPPPITHDLWCQLQRHPDLVPAETRAHISQLAAQYRFWHWHLAFPEVFAPPCPAAAVSQHPAGWTGGFAVVLSSLPWRTLGFDAQAWSVALRPEIAAAPNATARRQQLAVWRTTDSRADLACMEARHEAARRLHLLRHTSSASPLRTTSRYAALHFLAWCQLLVRPTGRIGCLAPAPVLLREHSVLQQFLDQQILASFVTCSNATHLVSWSPRTALFALLTLTGSQCPQSAADVVWLVRQLEDLNVPSRHVSLQAADLTLLNPNTRAYPALRSTPDATLVKKFYRHIPILRHADTSTASTWDVQGCTMLHLTRHAALLRTPSQLEAEGWRYDGDRFRYEHRSYVPVYEGSMVHALSNPLPQDVLTPPRWWVPASHIVQATSYVPEGLLQAYEHKRPQDILHVLASWLGGQPRHQGQQAWTRDTLVQLYNPMFQALPVTPGAWAPEPELARRWPLTPDDLRLIQRQHDVLLLARQLIAQRCPTWLVSWRERLDPTYAVHATVLPRVGLAQTAPWLRFAMPHATLAGCLVANLTSLVMAFCVRQKVLGSRLTPELLYQLPLLPPSTYAEPCAWDPQRSLQAWLMPRILALLYTSAGLTPWARACDYDGPPFRLDAASHVWYRSELEAAYCCLYGCTRADVLHLLDTTLPARPQTLSGAGWPAREHLLQRYEALQQAVISGLPYRTSIAPPAVEAPTSTTTRTLRQPPQTRGLQQLVAPSPAERYKTCVPLFELQAVVNAFAEGQDLEPESWIIVPAARTLRPGMFVARMVGAAMEPQIPAGAHCLFERQGAGNLQRFQGRVVLAQHQDIDDPDTGGAYTVRRYVQERGRGNQRAQSTPLVRLLSLQTTYPPIVLTPQQTDRLCIIAEFLTVLDAGEASA